jgi:hypothetical protein
MTNREKIIVGLAVLSVIYGVYILFLASPSQPSFEGKSAVTTKGLEAINAFITKVAEAAKEGLSEQDSYILEKAQTQWKKDPFIKIEKENQVIVKKAETEPSIPDATVSYTGYLEMGNARIAIIDGREYVVGELLERGGFKVRNISASRVVLVTTDGSGNMFTVPMQETQ